MTKPYVLSSASLLALAAGDWDPATAQTLFSAQTSTNNLLASHVFKSMAAGEQLEQAATVLSQAQDRQPQATAILCHQAWMGSWIARCLDALKEPRANRLEMNRQAARIGNIAAVAALRAGIDAETFGLAENGLLVLPTLGAFPLGSVDSVSVRLAVRDGALKLYAGKEVLALQGRPPNSWLAMRRLTASDRGYDLDLIFDDLDPLRDCFGETLTGRVPDDRFSRWNELFSAGWQLLCRHSPQRAAEVAECMRVLVPVAEATGRSEISVTSQEAMGALAMTLPHDRARMAIALVHEQAHSTLNGLLNLLPLFDRSDRTGYFAPWRPDPRPIGGLLHGTYAFLSVAETWLRFSADTALRRTALHEYALRRAQLDTALNTLGSVGSWTPQGREFVAGMRLRCDGLLAEPIPANIDQWAKEELRRQHAHWRQRNRQQ